MFRKHGGRDELKKCLFIVISEASCTSSDAPAEVFIDYKPLCKCWLSSADFLFKNRPFVLLCLRSVA